MDEQTLLARIKMLEQQLALLKQLVTSSGEGGASENNTAVPIPSVATDDKTISTNSFPPGSSSEANVLDNIILKPMTDANNYPDTNVKFDMVDDGDDTTTLKIGVYYV